MSMHIGWGRSAIAVTLLSIGSAAVAVPVPYFGEDLTPNQTVPAGGASATARSVFEATLASRQVDGLEDADPVQSGLPPLALFGGAATLTMSEPAASRGRIENNPILGGAFQGRFNTTAGGANWWQANTQFEIFFAQQTFAAFGFYGTDFGDFLGGLSLDLLDANKIVVATLAVPESGDGSNNGSLLFFGFTDSARSYSGVRFNIAQAGTDPDTFDTLGFDDLVVGTLRAPPPPNGAPEPGSLALVGASLFGLAAARCRRS